MKTHFKVQSRKRFVNNHGKDLRNIELPNRLENRSELVDKSPNQNSLTYFNFLNIQGSTATSTFLQLKWRESSREIKVNLTFQDQTN